MKKKILVVDDEVDHARLIKDSLTSDIYNVETVESADDGLKEIRLAIPDLLILDCNLPGITGVQFLEILKKDKKTSQIPVIMLTAKSGKRDKLLGLETGADDYITKPFDTDELMARVTALFRRLDYSGDPGLLIEAGGLVLDLEGHEVSLKGRKLDLRPKEFKLLTLLIQKRGRVLSRKYLSDAIWGEGAVVTTHTMESHIGNLRSKLEKSAQFIETVHGVGYKFKEE